MLELLCTFSLPCVHCEVQVAQTHSPSSDFCPVNILRDTSYFCILALLSVGSQGSYVHHKELKAAIGIKITAQVRSRRKVVREEEWEDHRLRGMRRAA